MHTERRCLGFLPIVNQLAPPDDPALSVTDREALVMRKLIAVLVTIALMHIGMAHGDGMSRRDVDLHIVGGEAKLPVAGLDVTVETRSGHLHRIANSGRLDESGRLRLELTPSRHRLRVTCVSCMRRDCGRADRDSEMDELVFLGSDTHHHRRTV